MVYPESGRSAVFRKRAGSPCSLLKAHQNSEHLSTSPRNKRTARTRPREKAEDFGRFSLCIFSAFQRIFKPYIAVIIAKTHFGLLYTV